MKNLKKSFIIIMAFVLVFVSGCSSEKTNTEKKEIQTAEKIVTSSAESIDHKRVVLEIQDYGNLVVETYPEEAPETVSRFLELVEMGYYDGMSFDKINPGFSMEISDETALSSGEYKETVTGEFAKNGFSNGLALSRGTLAMCYLPGEYNSATAKFMIILNDDLGIDGSYAGFAKVVDGSGVFDKISKIAPNADGSPVSPIVMKKAYID